MSNKPRPSLLELFDPLHVAINTPVPDSPPGTPCRDDSKENINGLTMTAFFNRISKSKSYTKPYNNSDILIDVDGRPGNQKVRTPLLVKEINVATTPVPQRSGVELPKELFLTSRSHQYSSNVPSLQDSPSRDVFPCDAFLPIITTDTLVETQTPSRGGRSNAPSHGLAKVHRAHSWRRRSSIDISAALSSTSLNVPDLSFDLLNGDISFLSKTSERDDSDTYMRRRTPSPEQADSTAGKENLQEKPSFIDICSLDHDCDNLVNEPEPNALADSLSAFPIQEVVGSQPLQYESQQSTPTPVQRSMVVLPTPVKKSKVFTSHRKMISTDITTANFNRYKQHIAPSAHQINTGTVATLGGSATSLATRGARRVLINVDKDMSATAVPTTERLPAKPRLPMLRSDVLPPRTHMEPVQLVSSKLAGISKSVIATGASRLPAPKGRGRPVSKTGISGIAKPVNRRP